jgi:hypothetical protein
MSEPAAYAVVRFSETSLEGVLRDLSTDINYATYRANKHGGIVVPLYRPPFLTDRERVGVLYAIATLETDTTQDGGQNEEAAGILREMLDRIGGT